MIVESTRIALQVHDSLHGVITLIQPQHLVLTGDLILHLPVGVVLQPPQIDGICLLNKKEERKIEAAEMKFLRGVAGYTLWDRKRNDIRKELKIFKLTEKISQYRNDWIEHLEWMEDDRIPKLILNYKPNGSNKEPRDIYKDPDIIALIKSRRLHWLGHVLRRDEDSLLRKAFNHSPRCKRPLGRPCLRWHDKYNI
ncbi:hypothetical protein ANN_13254 [Periplaneta americana]|uniref:Uncharacterized protein n=1 Tax=Periplaneta americana TaxID=6978 RepID=A0ABQ8TKQ6_PERAM|nr:hypothetical protein ANN_13254 [Periplaneta americana]